MTRAAPALKRRNRARLEAWIVKEGAETRRRIVSGRPSSSETEAPESQASAVFGAGVIFGSRRRAGDGFRGSGGSGGGCRVLISGIEVGVKICFKICSEDCFEGEFQVISKVKGRVKVVVKDGQC